MPLTTPDGITYTDEEVKLLGLDQPDAPVLPPESVTVVDEQGESRPYIGEYRGTTMATVAKESPRHRLVCNHLAIGWTNRQICDTFGIHPTTVTKIRRDPRFRKIVADLQERDRQGAMKGKLYNLQELAIDVLEQVLLDPKAKNADKIAASKTTLDRTGLVTTTEVRHGASAPDELKKMTDAELLEIIRRGQISGN